MMSFILYTCSGQMWSSNRLFIVHLENADFMYDELKSNTVDGLVKRFYHFNIGTYSTP